MASKSKSRRRVLRASCLLAALIVAGSSFAWFTSKDEVTNRLSAKADYDVAIAEDFTPPENWIPGQQINKDVGAVNTGNVDAFVRTYLQGEMRILQTTPIDATFSIDDWNAGTGTFNTTTLGYFNKTTAENDVEDSELVKMGLTKFYEATANTAPRYYFKSLSTTSTKNPRDNQQTNYQDDYNSENDTDYYSEVQAMQAGGVLAYAPTGAEYTYVLNQEAELPIYSTDGTNKKVVTRKVPAGTRVYVTNVVENSIPDDWRVNTTSNMNNVKTVWVPAQKYTGNGGTNDQHFNPVNVDADSFQPLTPGLYLFNRNIDLKADTATANDYEFSGYYYSDYNTVITDNNGTTTMSHATKQTKVDSSTQKTTNDGNPWVDADGNITAANGDYGKGTYYALKAENDIATGDNRSDYTVPTAAVTVTPLDNDLYYIAPTSSLELYTASYSKIDSASLKWRTTSKEATDGKLYAIYDKDEGNDIDTTDDIVIEIGLKNIGNTNSQWTAISDQSSTVTGFTLPYSAGDVTANWDAAKLTFYYNDDVESGDTTERFIDYVKLADFVTDEAYLAFDFDLNVFMDSVQVTYAENGNELTTPVEEGGVWDNATNTAVTGAKATAQNAAEVGDTAIEWKAYTSTP